MTTWIPAFIALVATSVRAAPSVGSSTMASTLSLMKVSIWLICRLASLVPSAVRNSMSEYFPASALAALLIAPSQPWSAAGPENPMTTLSPGASLSLAARGALLCELLSSSALLPVHPAATTTSTPRPAATRRPRERGERRTDMISLFCEMTQGAG